MNCKFCLYITYEWTVGIYNQVDNTQVVWIGHKRQVFWKGTKSWSTLDFPNHQKLGLGKETSRYCTTFFLIAGHCLLSKFWVIKEYSNMISQSWFQAFCCWMLLFLLSYVTCIFFGGNKQKQTVVGDMLSLCSKSPTHKSRGGVGPLFGKYHVHTDTDARFLDDEIFTTSPNSRFIHSYHFCIIYVLIIWYVIWYVLLKLYVFFFLQDFSCVFFHTTKPQMFQNLPLTARSWRSGKSPGQPLWPKSSEVLGGPATATTQLEVVALGMWSSTPGICFPMGKFPHVFFCLFPWVGFFPKKPMEI